MLRLRLVRFAGTLGRDYTRKAEIIDWENKDRDGAQLEILQTVTVLQ